MINKKMNLMGQLFQVGTMLRWYQKGNFCNFSPIENCVEQVLLLLKSKTELSKKELSELLSIRPLSLEMWLERLEDDGLITCFISAEDNGVENIELTKVGIKVAERIEQKREGANKLFDCLSDEEKASLSKILGQLTDELEKESNDNDMDAFNYDELWNRHGYLNFDSWHGKINNRTPFEHFRGMFDPRPYNLSHCGRSHHSSIGRTFGGNDR